MISREIQVNVKAASGQTLILPLFQKERQHRVLLCLQAVDTTCKGEGFLTDLSEFVFYGN